MAVTREELMKFLKKHVRKRKEFSKITDDTELFTSGVIDSFAMIDLLTWLEKKGGVRIDKANVSLEAIDSVNRILEFSAKSGAR